MTHAAVLKKCRDQLFQSLMQGVGQGLDKALAEIPDRQPSGIAESQLRFALAEAHHLLALVVHVAGGKVEIPVSAQEDWPPDSLVTLKQVSLGKGITLTIERA